MIELPKNEKVVVKARRHWIAPTAIVAAAVLLQMLLWGVGIGIALGLADAPATRALSLLGTSTLSLLLLLQFFVAFINYFLDVWIVTTKRVIEVEQHGLFHREFSEFTLDRVQDVSIDTKGFLSTMLHYSDVHIQTAGASREFIFKQVPLGQQIKDTVVREHEHYMKQLGGTPDRHHR